MSENKKKNVGGKLNSSLKLDVLFILYKRIQISMKSYIDSKYIITTT